MPVTDDILRSYRHPRRVMRRVLDTPQGETRALVYVMIACLLFFVAQLPAVSRQAHLTGGDPGFAALASGTFMGAVLMAPLVLYGLAGLSHVVARLLGGRGDWLGARLALFWTLLLIVPVVLLRGLTEAFLGRGSETSLLSLVIAAIFAFYWLLNLREAESASRTGPNADPAPDTTNRPVTDKKTETSNV